MLETLINSEFGHKVRLRVCGILLENEGLLLLRHNGIGKAGYLWSPPGGGVLFGEPISQTLQREFAEETGLQVEVQEFLFFHEHISATLHAVELMFKVTRSGGDLKLGLDPELPPENQILSDIRFWTRTEIATLKPENVHAKVLHMFGV